MGTAPYDRRSTWEDTAWETKIVRARNREFGQRDHLETLKYQEHLAGWILIEKYNDSTVRFARQRSMQARDRYLPRGIDPYRTVYVPEGDPVTQNVHALILGIAAAASIMVLVLLVVLSTFHM